MLLAADTLFDFDKATLTPAARVNLTRVADLVRQGSAGAVTVIGHTDSKGEDGYNLALSRQRADAMAQWLRGQPWLPDRPYRTEGTDEAEPVRRSAPATAG